VLEGVGRALTSRHPGLDIVYAYSPPVRELTAEEDEGVVAAIAGAGVEILFVGLGCPKQERWMMAHRDSIDCLMLGVGAAFEMLAEVRPTAPRWVQRLGLEWLLRLANDPRRLWRRYARYNLRFLVLVGRQLLADRRA
jgi:N-acetylglucosaminyldiphosphoundecaprenol N-acetyl-beta-D-mannosaminyltransferase